MDNLNPGNIDHRALSGQRTDYGEHPSGCEQLLSPGFFRMDFSSPEKRQLKATRILDFAETLINLQEVRGFNERINQMRTCDPESTFAELDFGRFLYIHDIDFCFVTPTGKKSQDYDCAVAYCDGRAACADAKCRIEDSEIQPRAIRHALETARKKNLPKDELGIVFIKVPQAWMEFEVLRMIARCRTKRVQDGHEGHAMGHAP